MTTIFIGVDPGQSGAIAAVLNNGHLWWLEDMPNPLHGAVIRDLLGGHGHVSADPSHFDYAAAVEKQQAHSKQQGQTDFITGYGIILGAFGYAGIPYQIVPPGTWKRQAGLLGKDKDASRKLATELWPAWADSFKLSKHHGRAEAALIARWAWRNSLEAAA